MYRTRHHFHEGRKAEVRREGHDRLGGATIRDLREWQNWPVTKTVDSNLGRNG